MNTAKEDTTQVVRNCVPEEDGKGRVSLSRLSYLQTEEQEGLWRREGIQVADSDAWEQSELDENM